MTQNCDQCCFTLLFFVISQSWENMLTPEISGDMKWINETFLLFQTGEADDRDQSKLEVKMWDPECPLTNKQIDQFLVVARYEYAFGPVAPLKLSLNITRAAYIFVLHTHWSLTLSTAIIHLITSTYTRKCLIIPVEYLSPLYWLMIRPNNICSLVVMWESWHSFSV